MMDHIVEAQLENLQHLLARDATAAQSALVNSAELALKQAVIIAEFLLFHQAKRVVSLLAARLWTMNTRRVLPAFQIFCRPENRKAELATDANARTCVTCHTLYLRFE